MRLDRGQHCKRIPHPLQYIIETADGKRWQVIEWETTCTKSTHKRCSHGARWIGDYFDCFGRYRNVDKEIPIWKEITEE